MLIAGEASGDAHGAEVVRALELMRPGIRFSAMGSRELRDAGVDIYLDSSSIAVVGIVEVLKHWGDIKHAMETVKQRIVADRPDLLVLIDYQEFNLKIARFAKAIGVKVLFYISPQVWAWRPKRIHKIGQAIDHMAVLFEFEAAYYDKAGIPATFVGHPLVDKVRVNRGRDAERARLGVATRLVGLFPGSRNSEIQRLLPLMLETAGQMLERDPTLEFVMPLAATLDHAPIRQACLESGLDIHLTDDNLYDVIVACDAIVSCSGTVTLEIALLGVPMCIVYKMSWLSYQIMSRLITIEHIGLANIVAGKPVVQELLQNDATPQAISNEIMRLLADGAYRQQVVDGLSEVRANLGPGHGAENMATLVLEQLDSKADAPG
jgi:lipid-A-disaccharide synthase